MTPWRVVILENEYLSCRILPDLGGHLHGCTDRITGKEIFYSNPAIRRTGESPRGTFIATGIESSFPIAHSRVDSSPVDYAWSLRDGVGRVVVEDTDRTSGMQWRDEFILHPGSTVLEQRVTLYNGSAARRGYQMVGQCRRGTGRPASSRRLSREMDAAPRGRPHDIVAHRR